VDFAGRVLIRRRALARFDIAGRELGGLGVFEWTSARTWSGRTLFAPKADQPAADVAEYLDERARYGLRLHGREG
jgi:hypothetical protein